MRKATIDIILDTKPAEHEKSSRKEISAISLETNLRRNFMLCHLQAYIIKTVGIVLRET